MKNYRIIIFAASTLMVTACTYQKNNRIEQDDVNKDNQEVYGVSPDSSAKQLKNVYTAKPENEQRVNAIREKLYGKAAVVETGV